jgi:mRNA interferase MazF
LVLGDVFRRCKLRSQSVLVCLLTTGLRKAPLYRLSLPADDITGLREPSQVMVDKIMAVRFNFNRCRGCIGRADDAALLALGRPLALVVGNAVEPSWSGQTDDRTGR